MVDLHFLSKTKADNPTSYFRNLMAQVDLLDTTRGGQGEVHSRTWKSVFSPERCIRSTAGKAEQDPAVGCPRLALKLLEASTRMPRPVLACKHLNHITSFPIFKAEKMLVQQVDLKVHNT